eukprot:gene17012-22516_t
MRLKNALEEVILINSKTKVFSRERSSRLSVDPSLSARSIYVSGLAWDTKDEELQDLFSSVGTITNAYVLKQKRAGKERSLGCGIVEFEASESAQAAITHFNETLFKDRIIRIREDKVVESTDISPLSSTSTASSNSTTYTSEVAVSADELSVKSINNNKKNKVFVPNKIFISNISKVTTVDDMTSLFKEYGEIVSINVLPKKGRKTLSWIVEYQTEDQAKIAIESCNKLVLHDLSIIVRDYYQ